MSIHTSGSTDYRRQGRLLGPEVRKPVYQHIPDNAFGSLLPSRHLGVPRLNPLFFFSFPAAPQTPHSLYRVGPASPLPVALGDPCWRLWVTNSLYIAPKAVPVLHMGPGSNLGHCTLTSQKPETLRSVFLAPLGRGQSVPIQKLLMSFP